MYSAISKFKRLELTLRQALVEYGKAIDEIDRALGAKRNKKERDLLLAIREESIELQMQSTKVIQHLYRGV